MAAGPREAKPVSRTLAGPAGGPDVVVDLIRRWFTITFISRGNDPPFPPERNAPALQWAAARAFNASGAPAPHPARRSLRPRRPQGWGGLGDGDFRVGSAPKRAMRFVVLTRYPALVAVTPF